MCEQRKSWNICWTKFFSYVQLLTSTSKKIEIGYENDAMVDSFSSCKTTPEDFYFVGVNLDSNRRKNY